MNVNGPHSSSSLHRTRAMSAASEGSDDGAEFFRSNGGGAPFSGGLGAVSSPSWRPEIRELRPSHRDAQNAFDQLEASFANLNGDLPAPTVDKHFRALEKTTETVRAWLDASQAGIYNDMSALGNVFTDVESSLDAAAFQQGMATLDTMFSRVDAQIQKLDPSSVEYRTARAQFGEAVEAFHAAQNPDADLSQRATEAQAALGDLTQAARGYTDFLEHHMQVAETEVANLRGHPAVATDGHSVRSDTETAMNALETVLSSGTSGSGAGDFDIDGFVQLLYKNQALGSTISSAASRYSVSGPEMRDFVGNIPDIDTRQTAHEVALEMFGSRDHIDLGSYLREILSRTPEPRRPTAYEAFCEAMKHMRPITRGDANIHGTP